VLKMAKTVYIDTSRTAINGKKKRKPRILFDGEKVFKINKLTKLENVDEVFIDTLFPEIYEEVLELLKRGVKIYLLKDTRIIKRLRLQNNLKKTHKNDSLILSWISKDLFRRLNIEDMEFKIKIKPLINKYKQMVRWKKRLKGLISRGFDYNFKEPIKLMEKDLRRTVNEIIFAVYNSHYAQVYRKACDALGLKDSAELAVLTLELPLHLPLKRLKGLLGCIPGRNNGKYNRQLRVHVTRLAANLWMNAKRHVNFSDYVSNIVDGLPRRKAIYRLELIILKALRRAYLTTKKLTADNPAGQ